MVCRGIQQITEWKSHGNKLAIYCAGLHGIMFNRIFEYLNIVVDVFLDNNEKKVGKCFDGIKCVSPVEIVDDKSYMIVICIGIEKYRTILEVAKKQGFQNIIDFRSVLDDLIVYHSNLFLDLINRRYYENSADLFYTNDGMIYTSELKSIARNGDRIAVYTGAFGGYDDFFEPMVFPDNIDYYYISDEEPARQSKYTWMCANDIIPNHIVSPIKRNRYIKMHPHIIFPEYKYSIYLDANVRVISDLTDLICNSKSGISVFEHWRRDCLYYEAMTIVNHKRIVPEDAVKQISKYLREGMPLHFGLPELPVIAREHNKVDCVNVMNTWWEEFDNESQRDQLSFPYALWKNNYSLTDVAILGNCIRESKLFKFYNHHYNSKNIRNDKIIETSGKS